MRHISACMHQMVTFIKSWFLNKPILRKIFLGFYLFYVDLIVIKGLMLIKILMQGDI
ncbi:hypothetical protein THF5G08_40436 [Vibrio jasicida]|nr:hypothetical protein THF5G08_40436 [Vibrio jasicida]